MLSSINDSEFANVSELQIIYDEARCFFLQWVMGKEIKELVNSARISAVQSGKTFTWIHARIETLKSMTDVTLTACFLALARLKRAQGTTAKLWISQVLTRKALLEDPKLPAPILLPECLYLEILVGQMSAQETTVFDHCPANGDDLLQNKVLGQRKFPLDKLKRSIDARSNPPYFRGVSTPITDLLDSAESRPPKQKRDQAKAKKGKTKDGRAFSKSHDKDKGANNPHLARRPEHEQPAKFPEGLKRPDLEATVDGDRITSAAQRQLYDDIKRGNCTRCDKGGHIRKDCREPKAKWEDKFDKEQANYWTSVLKWQQRASDSKANPTVTSKAVTLAPTLHVKPEKRFQLLAPDYGSDDEPAPLRSYRLTTQDPVDTDDDDDVPPSRFDDADTAPAVVAPTPVTVAAILADVDRRLAHYPRDDDHIVMTNGNATPAPRADDHNVMKHGDATPARSDHVVMTNEDDANLDRISTHVNAIMAGAASRLYVLNTTLGHHLPPPPLTDADITAHIADIYAYYYADTSSDDDIKALIAERRPLTPCYAPASPASSVRASSSTHDDITYNLSDVFSHASIGLSTDPVTQQRMVMRQIERIGLQHQLIQDRLSPAPLPPITVESGSSTVVIPPMPSSLLLRMEDNGPLGNQEAHTVPGSPPGGPM
jgi:hypothetical protein